MPLPPPPKELQVVDMTVNGGMRYIVLRVWPEDTQPVQTARPPWCKVDLMNTTTSKVFVGHEFIGHFSVDEPADWELAKATAHLLTTSS